MFIFVGVQKQLQAQSSHPEEPPRLRATNEQQAQGRSARNPWSSKSNLLPTSGQHYHPSTRLPLVPQAVRLQSKTAAAPTQETLGPCCHEHSLCEYLCNYFVTICS
jgi:hypothetical protein